MSILDDIAIFTAVVSQGGFSHGAKKLGLSNGLVSRRIVQLESKLDVTLIKRTTRRLHLTQEGEILWQHAQRMQKEFDAAISLIQSSAKKPKGIIRVSAPPYFGRHYLTPIIVKFLTAFSDIQVDLILSHKRFDLIEEKLDLVIRGAGYIAAPALQDSSLKAKQLMSEKIGLYASTNYLHQYGEPKSPDELSNHVLINCDNDGQFLNEKEWIYRYQNKETNVVLKPRLNCNDLESALIACSMGCGIGRFTELDVKMALKQQELYPILKDYDWGNYHRFVLYSHQQTLPKRTRLLLELISTELQMQTIK